MNRIVSLFLSIAFVVSVVACGTVKKTVPVVSSISIALSSDSPRPNRFVGLDYGIRLNVSDGRSTGKVISKHDSYLTSSPKESVSPDVMSFVSESCRRYMRTSGFNLDADIATDYLLNLTVKDFDLAYLSGLGWSAVVQLNVEVYDRDRTLVYPDVVAVGRASLQGNGRDNVTASAAINKAYKAALDDIDWDRIAFFLKKASSPKLEANKSVSGTGATALESMVIRWYIDSSPKGADVSVRVISSTPEVLNTNSNYVGSTPHETTETFDIKGLTYNNSGNVQIEVVCEKAGYITQKKRFNLRQAIDQKEISTKFNLIKEE